MLIIIFFLLALGVVAGLGMLISGIVLLCKLINKTAGILLTIFGGIIAVVMIFIVIPAVVIGTLL